MHTQDNVNVHDSVGREAKVAVSQPLGGGRDFSPAIKFLP
jgi:hypothetical protein